MFTVKPMNAALCKSSLVAMKGNERAAAIPKADPTDWKIPRMLASKPSRSPKLMEI